MKNLFFFFMCIFLLSGCSSPGIKENIESIEIGASKTPQICFKDTCFKVEIADDDYERRKGLMRRTKMADDAGMLFIFDDMKKGRKFRMKNTKIPLDMVWLDDEKRIVFIEKDVPPCTQDQCPNYGPDDKESKYVIELNAGEINKIGSAIGDKILIK